MFPANILQTVQTFNESNLSLMHAMLVAGEICNTNYLELNKLPGNLGQTAKFKKPLKVTGVPRLNVINDFQAINQEFVTLSVDQQFAIPVAMTAEEIVLYELDEYLRDMGQPIVTQLATNIDRQVLSVGEEQPFLVYQGNLNYADTVLNPADIIDIKELPKIEAQFENFGMTKDKVKVVLPNMAVPNLINTGLNQFVTRRNDDLAQSWMLGSYSHSEYFRSNLLTDHVAGGAGQNGYVLTLTNISADGLTLTFSSAGPANEADTIKAHDTIILDPTNGLRYYGSAYSASSGNWVSVNAQADADTVAGVVVVTVNYPLIQPSSVTGARVTINQDLVLNTQTAKVLNSHRCAFAVANNALFLGMPPLPSTMPYPSNSKVDDVSKLSMRMYYGAIPFQNEYGYSWDAIWGRNCDAERIFKIAYPSGS